MALDVKKVFEDALNSGALPAFLRVVADTVERDPSAIAAAFSGNYAPLAIDVAKAAPELIGAIVKVIIDSNSSK